MKPRLKRIGKLLTWVLAVTARDGNLVLRDDGYQPYTAHNCLSTARNREPAEVHFI